MATIDVPPLRQRQARYWHTVDGIDCRTCGSHTVYCPPRTKVEKGHGVTLHRGLLLMACARAILRAKPRRSW